MNDPTSNRVKVKYKDLREYLTLLEENGLLHRIKASVDPHLEIGAIAARGLDRKGPALWFDNVKGYEGMPFVTNIISTTEQLALTFNTEADEDRIQARVVEGMEERINSVTLPTGPCKDVIIREEDVDIDMIPTPFWHEHDGGRYLGTTAGLISRDPETGILNMGAYRVMIKGKKVLSWSGGLRGKNASSGPGGGDHILENERNGKPTPVAIVMGMDPLLTLANGSPVRPGEDGSMEYEAAGGWRGSPTELVKCETNDLLVPAHAEMIIEGLIPPNERTKEGPHGKSTGFYGENTHAFVVNITCITHRKDPITYGLICQRIEDYPRQLLRSGSLQSRIIQKTGFTNIKQVYFPEVGRHGMLIVSAKIRDKDDPQRIMNGIWEDTGERWRWIIVVDEDCNVRDWEEVMWRVASVARPEIDVILGREHNKPMRTRGDVDFDPPSRGMGIDATMHFKDLKLPPINKINDQLMQKVAARWDEFGLP